MEKSNNNTDKGMAELYYKLYSGCIKYKKEKDKQIDCDEFYKNFEFYANKSINNKVN
jgi:hypothetical protein